MTSPLENEYLIDNTDSVATSVGGSESFFRFSEQTLIEPNPGLVRQPFHQNFNQPLSYEDPFFFLQLPETTTQP